MTNFKPAVGILLLDENMREHAQSLATQYRLEIYSEEQASLQHYLVFNKGRLALRTKDVEAVSDMVVDFVGGKSGHRLRSGEGRGQTLAKAVGLKGGYSPRVLDITAGLGRDAFVLASLGCELVLLERSPWLSEILRDGLQRLAADETLCNIAERMQLHNIDAREYLVSLLDLPDVIYMDPMYPGRSKSALVKKEMRIIRSFVGEDNDIDETFTLALHKAEKRIVVKRPKGAGFIAQCQPNFQLESKNTRYDVYLPR